MKTNRIIALTLAVIMCFMAVGCGSSGSKKTYVAGDYYGSVEFNHPEEIEVMSFAGGGLQTVEVWGVDVDMNIDEEGKIWDIAVSAPEGAVMTTNEMMWPVSGSKFLNSFSGAVTVDQVMDMKVEVGDDGFPVLYGDCSGIDVGDTDVVLVNDFEVTCAMVILGLQATIRENGLD